MISIKPKLRKLESSSAAIVASNDDLLTHILLCLPVKSIVRFKCVSKHWLSLITSPYFTKLRTRHPIHASGLLLHRASQFLNPEHDFVPFDRQNPPKPPLRKLTFADDPSGIRILQSCNGLLLCCSFERGWELSANYYVYNPTTGQYSTLPKPPGTKTVWDIDGLSLAYDPSKSTHYKVVCVRSYELMSWNYKSSWYYQVDVYSSETRQWRVNCETFRLRHYPSFKNGVVYWNGGVHWGHEHSLYFDVDQEKVAKIPMPPDFPDWEESRIEYFGVSCGHLHLVQVNSRHATLLNIYEMERDRIRWSLRYHVNLESVVTAFPNTIQHDIPPTDYRHYAKRVLGLIRGEREEDSFLVLHIPGKAIRYNLGDKCFYELCDFAPPDRPYETDDEGDEMEAVYLQFDWFDAFQYVESHCIF